MEMFRWVLVLTGVVLLAVAYLMGRKPKAAPSVYHRAVPESYDPAIDELNLRVAEPVIDEHTDQLSVESGSYRDDPESVDISNYSDEYSNDVETVPVRGHEESHYSSDTRAEIDGPAGSPRQYRDDKVTSFASAVKIAQAEEEAVNLVEKSSADSAGLYRQGGGVDVDESVFVEEFDTYREPVQLDKFEEKLVTIHVAASPGEKFFGRDLKSLFDQHGYQYGRMSLYHCLLEQDKVFSIANMIKPGTFNEDQMESFETPGITLFMRLPIELDSDVAFDFLVREATELATELGGHLRDSNRNPLSEQTIQHMREDVQQYVFRTKRLLQTS